MVYHHIMPISRNSLGHRSLLIDGYVLTGLKCTQTVDVKLVCMVAHNFFAKFKLISFILQVTVFVNCWLKICIDNYELHFFFYIEEKVFREPNFIGMISVIKK